MSNHTATKSGPQDQGSGTPSRRPTPAGTERMSRGTRNIRIEVSQQGFALLADAVCTFSKATGRFQTLRSTVQHACEQINASAISATAVEQFLAEYSVEGEIGIWLEVKPEWSHDFDCARTRLHQLNPQARSDRVFIPLAIYLVKGKVPF